MPQALAFDMYGTLVNPLGIARRLERYELDADSVAAGWRETQLRYAALLTAMDRYEDFAWVTERSLEHALAVAGADLDGEARKELVRAYDELDAFPDTQPGLVRLREAGHTLVVLSNGTRDMIERILAHAGIRDPFEDLVSVDEVGRFKPSPRVYRHAADRLGRAVDDAWLVSANPFDVIGASSAGMRTAWVDRRGAPFDPLGPRPDLVVRDLGELADALGARR
jgi:2-haloacid dehalogenase